MPKEITDIDILRSYLEGVMDRADHHAQNVNEVALSIAGGVLWKKDDSPLKVMTREGEMKNVLWFKVGGKGYALSYNHETGMIEMRINTTHGRVISSFSNSMTNAEIRTIFEGI